MRQAGDAGAGPGQTWPHTGTLVVPDTGGVLAIAGVESTPVTKQTWTALLHADWAEEEPQ
jgi:hypothetical protein